MDCFAALAMTERVTPSLRGAQRRSNPAPCFLLRGACDGKRALLRHCLRQTRSVCAREPTGLAFGEPDDRLRDEAIHSFLWHGLLRCARNDGEARIASRSPSARIRATRWLAMTERFHRHCEE